jgi:uncharacterized protein YacL
MALIILRGVFLVVAAGVGLSIIQSEAFRDSASLSPWAWLTFVGVMLTAVAIIAIDLSTPRKRIEIISCVYLGILVGLFLTNLATDAIMPLLLDSDLNPTKFSTAIQLLVAIGLCYVCMSVLLQTKDDFRFIIPYVEFSKEVKGNKPYLLDTSVVIDGRIADLVDTGVLDSQLIMPRFVLAELQAIADSSDRLRRSRGRRGLDILNRLRGEDGVDLKIYDREFADMADEPVDMKLVLLAKHLDGKVVTGDYNLNKVARLHTVPVINLNDIANALKPLFLPGEQIDVTVVKAGEESRQGIGYLDDGTMIVVENGRDHIGATVQITVTSVLQKSAGRMIFGKYEGADQ